MKIIQIKQLPTLSGDISPRTREEIIQSRWVVAKKLEKYKHLPILSEEVVEGIDITPNPKDIVVANALFPHGIPTEALSTEQKEFLSNHNAAYTLLCLGIIPTIHPLMNNQETNASEQEGNPDKKAIFHARNAAVRHFDSLDNATVVILMNTGLVLETSCEQEGIELETIDAVSQSTATSNEQSDESQLNLSHLPVEIINHIGSFLPTNTLSHFSSACVFFKHSLHDEMQARKKLANALQIATGIGHTIISRGDGKVWLCGNNSMGSTNLEQQTNFSTFQRIPSLPKIKRVYTASNMTLFLSEQGTVWGCGENSLGELGLGHQERQLTPVEIPHLINIKQVLPTFVDYSLFLDEEGNVWGCGDHIYMLINSATPTLQFTPMKIPGLEKIKQMACTSNDHLFLCENGTVMGYSINQKGIFSLQGIPFTLAKIETLADVREIITGLEHVIFRCADNTVWRFGDKSSGHGDRNATSLQPMPVPGLSNIKQVSAGTHHTVFLKNDGTVWGYGDNRSSQLGLRGSRIPEPTQIPQLNDVKQVVAKYDHTFFLKNDGTVWGCGDNGDGQLGLGEKERIRQPAQLSKLIDIEQIATAPDDSFTLFLSNDGTVWGCGDNSDSQLGGVSDETVLTPAKLELPFQQELLDPAVSSSLPRL